MDPYHKICFSFSCSKPKQVENAQLELGFGFSYALQMRETIPKPREEASGMSFVVVNAL